MLEKEFIIKHDFTRRYLQNFINEVSLLKSDIRFLSGDRSVNAKSIIGVISANITRGDMVTIAIRQLNDSDIEGDLTKVLELLGDDE